MNPSCVEMGQGWDKGIQSTGFEKRDEREGESTNRKRQQGAGVCAGDSSGLLLFKQAKPASRFTDYF